MTVLHALSERCTQQAIQARSSVAERYHNAIEVWGSTPCVPTSFPDAPRRTLQLRLAVRSTENESKVTNLEDDSNN